MKKAVIGIVAHVDAGKTTLAESILFNTGVLRSQGRVDSGDTALDTDLLEKERGITIFSSQAVFDIGDFEVTLLDTPGHVDFSCETERVLRVLDAAVLVISGIDGVQSHTETIWKLLDYYNIPTFIFVTKMDYSRLGQNEILTGLKADLLQDCVDFSDESTADFQERIAVCSEYLLNNYLNGNSASDKDIADLISMRKLFPCYFGSGLKGTGVKEFLNAFARLFKPVVYPEIFGARVYKIGRDKNVRLTYIKVTGGSLSVRESIDIDGKPEKINRIRIYNGAKYVSIEKAEAGTVCAVEGLSCCSGGRGLGFEENCKLPLLEPVMKFGIKLPEDCDTQTFLPMLKQLEEAEPSLKVHYNSFNNEIQVGLMGKVQAEILRDIVKERYGISITLDNGTVMYKETVKAPVEGVGHYEPLRHYAEVHLIIEPLPRGSGIQLVTRCSEDLLDRSWQRLILSHLAEKQHLGVLTGSPLTDVKIVLAAGRAHLKHTEGGDFRQATYRAVRQGLMNAENILLEPWYGFTLTVPYEMVGRAISDIRLRFGEFAAPEKQGNIAVIKGRAPVNTFNDYSAEVSAYTSGTGRLICFADGYDICHNSEKVIDSFDYNPESDLENSPDSVFCAHGSGFPVKWQDVLNYMHLESCLKKDAACVPAVNRRNLVIDDKELEEIMRREFGEPKHELYRPTQMKTPAEKDRDFELIEREKWIIVDGYNVIFAWDNLKIYADSELGFAREKLMHILSNYSAYTKNNVVLVFDAYKVKGNTGERFDFHNIHVVYTKERELGDVYIERLIGEIGKNSKVTVVSSDGLIQLSAVRFGVLRESAEEFKQEVDEVSSRISETIDSAKSSNPKHKLTDNKEGTLN